MRTTLFVALLLLASGPARSQEGESVRESRVREILLSLDHALPDAIWSGAEELVKMGPAARRILQKSLPEAPMEGKLCALKALIELESTTFAAEELLKIARDEAASDEHRVLALELAGSTEEPDAEEALAELLLSLNPRIRVAAARALWSVGKERRQEAKDSLREMLRSTDRELRALGALALAEIGDADSPGVQAELRSLEREPTVRGRLAAALRQNLSLRNSLLRLDARGEAQGSGIWSHLDEIRLRLKAMYDDGDELPDEAMRSRAAHGLMQFPEDPHSAFMDPAEHAEWNEDLDPSYGGIGALIDTNATDFRISRPFFGGPAWKADIRTGDAIVAVNGKPTEGREQAEVVKEVKGPPGTTVILTIYREGWTETKEIPVVRAKIVLPSVFGRVLPGGIGYIEISNYGEDTGAQFVRKLRELEGEGEGIRGLVIDLRWNPGGSLHSVKECISPFLRGNDLICTIKGRAFPNPERHVAEAPERSRRYPISVLINGRSASGAELMSGVLQHYSKSSALAQAADPYLDAIVLGDPSFGKGTVQYKIDLKSWPGEAFADGDPKNDRWDDAEKFEDRNGSGVREPDEPFTDSNGNGRWDPAEPFTDANQNGKYDWGAALRMTVARYYLPGGRNFTRRRVLKEGKYAYEGGVEPDLKVQAPPMKGSHIAEFQEIQADGSLRDYVQSRWAAHQETFRKLAFEDGRDPARYPDFESAYSALAKCLTRQEFRRALRIEVRRQVANDIGSEIPGELSDDIVLRRGILEIFRRLGVDPNSIEEYRSIADHEKE